MQLSTSLRLFISPRPSEALLGIAKWHSNVGSTTFKHISTDDIPFVYAAAYTNGVWLIQGYIDIVVLLRRVFVFFKSSLQEMFCKKGVVKNFAKFTGKHLWQSLFFNKVAGLRIVKNTFFNRTPPVAASLVYIFYIKIVHPNHQKYFQNQNEKVV